MSNLTNQQTIKTNLAKKLGVSPEKIAMYDFNGNNLDKVIPVYSPTLAYLLCAVHEQQVVDIVEFEDSVYAKFKASQVVEDAIKVWEALTDKYHSGDKMQIPRLMGEYMKQRVSENNMKRIEDFYDRYSKKQEQHFKDCKDCKQHDKSS